MSRSSIGVDGALYDYLVAHGVREHPLLRRLRDEMADHPRASMQIAPEQGALMAMLVRLLDARRCLEVGVFTGYSSLAVAMALPEDGRLVACDVSEEWTRIARQYWEEAGVADKVELRLAPATETLDALLAGGEAGRFDFAFIDADKESYEDYYARTLELVRSGGLIVVDNVLWKGQVIGDGEATEATASLRAFNARRIEDERVELVMLPVADGITLLRKR